MTPPPILELQAEDLKLMLAASCHLGSKNQNAKMKRYIFTRRPDGIHIIHLGLLWEKLVLAARIIVAVENPRDVCIVSSCLNGRRSALKFGEYVGAACFIDRYIPGTLTNTTVKGYTEPLILISTDPYADAQVIKESQYCNMPVIALANSHNNLTNVDVAIPCNNTSRYSIGVITWLLARTVLRLKGWLPYGTPWNVKVDMFFYLEEKEKETEEGVIQTGEQPFLGSKDWNSNATAFEPQTSYTDQTLWNEQNYSATNSSWMDNISKSMLDFNQVFGPNSSEPFSWADDVDISMDPRLTQETGKCDQTRAKKDGIVDTGRWEPEQPSEGGFSEITAPQKDAAKAEGWGSSSHHEENGGWGPLTTAKQRQWGQ